MSRRELFAYLTGCCVGLTLGIGALPVVLGVVFVACFLGWMVTAT